MSQLYDQVAYRASRSLTLSYSSSFGTSSRFLSADIRPHIYAIYGLVRIADEIVDTYRGENAGSLLDKLEVEVYETIQSGYSANLIVHAFAQTARQFGIGKDLIAPFFASMRVDLLPATYDDQKYKDYIYGSAVVVGLMCLRVFLSGDQSQYEMLKDGASALGSAYQKVNFLRDLAADCKGLGRLYFPGVSFETFDDAAKQAIVDDIKSEFELALPAIKQLPGSSRTATMISYAYYRRLLEKLEATAAQTIKTSRVRVSTLNKLLLTAKVAATRGLR